MLPTKEVLSEMFDPCLAELRGKKGFALPEEADRTSRRRLTSRPGPQWESSGEKGKELEVVQPL